MDGAPERNDIWRKAAGSFALVVIVTSLAVAAWSGTDGVAGTRAQLFEASVVDLTLAGPRDVDGFLTKGNLAPGDRINGTLRLHNNQPNARDVLDLDFDVRIDDPHANRSVLLRVVELRYGPDDLLAPGGRDLLAEIDGNPLVGNGDGILTLHELQAGANDLPPPAAASAGGTRFDAGFEFDRAATEQAVVLARFAVVFHLADALHADLN